MNVRNWDIQGRPAGACKTYAPDPYCLSLATSLCSLTFYPLHARAVWIGATNKTGVSGSGVSN